MALTAEQWFPNVIWSGLLSNVNNTAIEDFAYERKEQDEGVKISNYIGWQSSSIKQKDSEAFDQLVNVITDEINGCAAQVQLPELQIQNIWILIIYFTF